MGKEYIEREAAIDALQNHYEVRNAAQNGIMDECVMLMMRVPAADVVHVRHGRWKPHSKVEVPVFHCSVCGGAALHAFGKQCKSTYCPNCGAIMDKGGDGE